MSALFHVVDDAAVILRAKGVYRQAKVYQREGKLFAAWGSGFIGLRRHGTTLPHVSVEDYDGINPFAHPAGHMAVEP